MATRPSADIAALAEAAVDEGEYEALDEALVLAIGAAKSGAGLWKLFCQPALSAQSFADDGYGPDVARALVERATSGKASDRALTLGLLVRLSSIDVCAALGATAPRPEDEAKAVYRDALLDSLPQLREGLAHKAAAVRAATAHLLGAWGEVSDLEALLEQLDSENDDKARASLLLGAGAIASRSDSGARERVAAALGEGPASPLELACRGAARALTAGALDDAEVEALRELLMSPSKLPPGWGWRDPKPLTTAKLATRVFALVPDRVPLAAVEAILDDEWIDSKEVDLVFELAFGGGRVPPLGIVRDELDEVQRTVVGAFARRRVYSDSPKMVAMGLIAGQVPAFLDGEGPLWRPVPISVNGVERTWNWVRIMRGVMWEELDEATAVAALTGGLPEETLLSATTHDLLPGAVTIVAGVRLPPAFWERYDRAILAIMDALCERGFDLAGALAKVVDQQWFDRRSLALGLLQLARRGGELPAEHEQAVIEGLKRARTPEPYLELLEHLPEARRRALLGATTNEVFRE